MRVYENTIFMEDIWRDQHTTDLYVADKFTRRASFGLLKIVIGQIMEKVPDVFKRGRLDPAVRIHSLTNPNELLGELPDGTPVIHDTSAGLAEPVFPGDFCVAGPHTETQTDTHTDKRTHMLTDTHKFHEKEHAYKYVHSHTNRHVDRHA